MAEKTPKTGCLLPLSRIRTIMKSSPEVSNIGQESLFLIAKATELFVQDLALKALDQSSDKHNVAYKDLSQIVNTQETLQFLQDIIPEKIVAREWLAQFQNEDEDGEQRQK